MAITVKHKFVSAIPDAGDTTIVQPSNWNDDHDLVGTIPVANGGTGASTATDGLNNLLPSQTSNTGKVLTTDGTNATWVANGSGTVTSVTGTAPVNVATGTTTPVVSLAASYGDTQNPYASKTANYVLAAPDGSAGVPTFRALTATDIPSLTGTYIPYTGASSAIDLNAKTVVNISNLGINTTTVPTISMRAVGNNNSSSRIAMRGYSSDASSSAIRVTKFRGTAGAPQAPQSGDSLGKFELAGYGTTSSEGYPQASLEGVATEAWGAVARGTKVVFKVTPNTTTTQVTALTIDQNSAATFASSVTATSFSGSGASLTSIPNSALVNSAITINGTSTSLGGSISVGTVTSVTGTAPVVSSGGATPAISMAAANTTTNGYLTSTDWNTFNGKGSGSVTSVAATVPSFLSIAGSPITTSGTLALTYSGTALPIANGGTGKTSATAAMANLMGFTSTATAAGTTTLDNTSSYYQLFTGTQAQTIVLPVTSTLQTGWTFHICNNSTGTLTVNSSGGNLVLTVIPGTTVMYTCIGTTLTTAADWEAGYTDFSTATGTGAIVLANSPTLNGLNVGSNNITFSNVSTNFTCSTQTTGVLTLGGPSQTGILTVGQSTVSQTTNIQAGATASGSTKTIAIGTGGLAGSTTAITIGSTTGTSTTTVNGTLTAGSGVTGGIAGGTF
jgi:hypothetical protein